MTSSQSQENRQPPDAAGLNLRSLLPLRALAVTLRFQRKARFSLLHQAAVHAFLRHLLASPPEFDTLIALDAPETGRGHYLRAQHYRFAVYGLAGSETLLAQLIARLRALPSSAKDCGPKAPLGPHLELVALQDLFSGKAVKAIQDLSLFDNDRLEAEARLWQYAPAIHLRWLSPARLLKAKDARHRLKGEQRFCRDPQDLSPALLLERLYDSTADLLRRRGDTTPPRGPAPDLKSSEAHLFWIDADYRDAEKASHPLGGISGELALGAGSQLPWPWLCLLVLGQYLGMGQRRAFGLGRYRLQAQDGTATLITLEPAQTLLQQAAVDHNLYAAYDVIRDNRLEKRPQADAGDPWDDEYPDMPDPEEEERLADRLDRLGKAMQRIEDPPPPLEGYVFREGDGDLRALAIPPFWDRVAQRAVVQELAVVMDPLMYERSYGYRPGRSRLGASLDIQKAWREGYRWVYEADIDDFFDTAQWRHLEVRLRALFRDDPVVERLLGWISAPVDYQGYLVERYQGLPQGAPASPLLANLLLDDFDRDLENAGFRLVRYADDFVVLCKDRERAEAAAIQVRASLDEIGLSLNEDKSGVVSFEQGFRYLGYLFLNELALDVGGQKDKPISAKPASAPPNSWLAKAVAQGARPLDQLAHKPTPGNSPKPPKPQGDTQKFGQQQDLGALILITGKSALLSTREKRLQVSRDDETILQAPWRGTSAVVLFGNHHITTPALRAAMSNAVPIHFAASGGQYQGVTWNATPGPEGGQLWLAQQARFADAPSALIAARQVVRARIRHMRETLRQRKPTGFRKPRQQLQEAINSTANTADLPGLNGVEGNATRIYFQALAELIPEEYGFQGRNRRPPRDPFNALLSLGYTLLYAHTDTLSRVAGLYPWTGFYHQSHGRHAALASDLMEPFRHLVERTALNALHRGVLTSEMFLDDPQRGCRLTAPALKQYLAMLWKRFDTPLKSVGEEEAHTPLYAIHQQNLRLVAWLRGGAEFKAWNAR